MTELRKSPNGQIWEFDSFTHYGNVIAHPVGETHKYRVHHKHWESWEVTEHTWKLELNAEELEWLIQIVFGQIPTKVLWTKEMIDDLRSKLLILKKQDKR